MLRTPTGARKNGNGDGVPSTSTERSRTVLPDSMRGRSRLCSNASRLARTVASLPAPPAMYPKGPGSSFSEASASHSSAPTGQGDSPVT